MTAEEAALLPAISRIKRASDSMAELARLAVLGKPWAARNRRRNRCCAGLVWKARKPRAKDSRPPLCLARCRPVETAHPAKPALFSIVSQSCERAAPGAKPRGGGMTHMRRRSAGIYRG